MPSADSLKGTKSPISIELSQRVQSVAPSVTLAIAAKAAEMKASGLDVVSLSAGEPDFDTPGYIKDAAISSLQRGETKYTPAIGTIDLRKAIARKLERDQHLVVPPAQIIVCTGAKHAIFNVMFALLNPGDEVIIPSPFWLSYPEMVTVLGGKSVFIETTEATEFKVTSDMLRKVLTPKSKILVLNSPSNPTGAVYNESELRALVTVLKDFPQVAVLSDEIYEKLIFDGRKHYSIAELDPAMKERTIVVNGMSKAYSMTGWRLGYAACPNKELAQAVGSIQSHSTSNATSFSQAGGVAALDKGEDDAKRMCEVFQKRRDFFIEKLSVIPQLKPFKAQGAFYLFADISKCGLGSLQVSERLLQEALVAVVPGKPFGSDKHIRMSFATSDKNLEEAASRLAAWFKKL